MTKLLLPNARTEVDMDRLAGAFSIGRDDLETRIGLGTITYWFEQGGSDHDTPRMIFRSADTGTQVTLDSVGKIVSRTGEGSEKSRASFAKESRDAFTDDPGTSKARLVADDPPLTSTTAENLDELLDEALKESFPASDPIAICFESPKRTARTSSESDKE